MNANTNLTKAIALALLSSLLIWVSIRGAEPFIQFGYQSPVVARLDEQATYSFAGPATVVSMTKTSLVVQVQMPSLYLNTICAVDHGGQPCPDTLNRPPFRLHRLHFKVAKNMIEFERTEEAKYIPSTPHSWEWEKKP